MDGLAYLLEVSVAEVIEKFFERTAYFEPRVSPSIGAIDIFLERKMLYDVGRMAQGKLERVPLHGVHAAQTVGNCIEVG